MAKNLLFFFDGKTSKILCHLIFEGEVVSMGYEDHETFVVNVEGYDSQIRGDITPIYERGTLKLRVSEIKDGDSVTDLVMLMLNTFDDRDDPQKTMEEAVREYAQWEKSGEEHFKEVREQFIREVEEDLAGFRKLFKKVSNFFDF